MYGVSVGLSILYCPQAAKPGNCTIAIQMIPRVAKAVEFYLMSFKFKKQITTFFLGGEAITNSISIHFNRKILSYECGH